MKVTLARPWALPGTPGLEHRIGGIEKQHITGNVNYDPENHHLMVKLRQEKVDRAVNDIPPMEIFGEKTGKFWCWVGDRRTARLLRRSSECRPKANQFRPRICVT